jgi:hypothetical protein
MSLVKSAVANTGTSWLCPATPRCHGRSRSRHGTRRYATVLLVTLLFATNAATGCAVGGSILNDVLSDLFALAEEDRQVGGVDRDGVISGAGEPFVELGCGPSIAWRYVAVYNKVGLVAVDSGEHGGIVIRCSSQRQLCRPPNNILSELLADGSRSSARTREGVWDTRLQKVVGIRLTVNLISKNQTH